MIRNSMMTPGIPSEPLAVGQPDQQVCPLSMTPCENRYVVVRSEEVVTGASDLVVDWQPC